MPEHRILQIWYNHRKTVFTEVSKLIVKTYSQSARLIFFVICKLSVGKRFQILKKVDVNKKLNCLFKQKVIYFHTYNLPYLGISLKKFLEFPTFLYEFSTPILNI